MKSKALITLALSAFLLASTASAKLPTDETWSRLETEHFTLFSNLDEPATREIGADLERLRMALEIIFPKASFDSPLPTLLYIFKDEASFAPYSLSGGTPGFLVPHSQANFAAVMGANADEALPIVYRQYLLELINDNVPQLPPWFRTGLAELFSTFEADEKQALVGRVGGGELGIHVSDSSSPSRLLAGTAMAGGDETALSHALVHYLMVEDADRREKTQGWVRTLDDNPDSRASLLTALGTQGDELDEAVASYLARVPLPSKSFALDGEVAAGDLQPMARHEALFHLGDLLIHSSPDRLAEATQHFEEALELAPEAARPLAGVGLAREKAGDFAAAESYYEQAISKRPDAFRLQFLYGDVELQLLGKRRPSSAEEEARLEKAIGAFGHTTELNPGFGEGWARLGYSYNLQTKPSSDAIPALERAYEMLPDRSDVAYNLLLGYARSGKRQEATTLVSNLEARGADEGTLQRSREVLYQLDFQAAGRMAKEKRLDEAKKLFSQIAARSTDPAMKERAEKALTALGGS